MTFSYYREPDNKEQEALDAQRSRALQSADQKLAIDNLKASIINDRDNSNVFEQLGTFSKSLVDTGSTLLTKHIEDQQAQAHFDYHTGVNKNPGVLDDKIKSADNASKFVNQVADDIEKEDGVGSIVAEEVRSRDPYYVAAMQRIEIQDKVANARLALEEAKETLTITDGNGEPLAYADINSSADMAAWQAAFQSQFIRENFSNITPEAFASIVDEPLREVVASHSNRWATENASRQKTQRLELAQLDLTNAVRDKNATQVIQIAMNHIRSGRLSRSQVASTLATLNQYGELTPKLMRELKKPFPQKGGGTTTLAKQLGEDWGAIEQAAFTKRRADLDKENLAYLENEQGMREFLMKARESDDDGALSESYLQEAQENFQRENFGRRSKVLDDEIANRSAEVRFSDDQVEKYREQIRKGTFDRKLLSRLPYSVASQLQGMLNLAPNQSQEAEVKRYRDEIKNIAKDGANSTIAGVYAPSVGLMVIKLEDMYTNQINNGATPEQARDYVQAWHDGEVAKDKEQATVNGTVDQNKLKFKNTEGYPSLIRPGTAVLEDVRNRQIEMNSIRHLVETKDKEWIVSTDDALVTIKELEAKAKQLQRGVLSFSHRDEITAGLLGYSNPLAMYQDFAKNRNYKGPEMDLPPLIQVAEDTFSDADKALMNRYMSLNRTTRALANNGLVSGLPVRGEPKGDFSAADSYGAGWGALSRVIRYAEGTASDAGYNTMFTHKQFDSYGDHPRQLQSGGGYTSDAAGAYQFLSTTWDGARNALGLQDFSPASQEAGARYLTQNKRGVDPDKEIETIDEFRQVMDKLAPEWASLPYSKVSPGGFGRGSSYYGQGGKSLEELWSIYQKVKSRIAK